MRELVTWMAIWIDGWNSPDGWHWNDARNMGSAELPANVTSEEVVAYFRETGKLNASVRLLPEYPKRQRSRRRGKPFVVVDTAHGDPTVIEVQDAWTGEPLYALQHYW